MGFRPGGVSLLSSGRSTRNGLDVRLGHRSALEGITLNREGQERAALQRVLRGINEGLAVLPEESEFSSTIEDLQSALLAVLGGAPETGSRRPLDA